MKKMGYLALLLACLCLLSACGGQKTDSKVQAAWDAIPEETDSSLTDILGKDGVNKVVPASMSKDDYEYLTNGGYVLYQDTIYQLSVPGLQFKLAEKEAIGNEPYEDVIKEGLLVPLDQVGQ